METVAIEVVKLLLAPVINAAEGRSDAEQFEAERQALILAQRRIQQAIAERELPPDPSTAA